MSARRPRKPKHRPPPLPKTAGKAIRRAKKAAAHASQHERFSGLPNDEAARWLRENDPARRRQ